MYRLASQLLKQDQLERLVLARESLKPASIHDRVLQTSIASLLERTCQRRILHCLGDSHALAFRYVSQQRLLNRTSLTVNAVDGATALGLANPNSQTAALPTFEDIIRRLPHNRAILFVMGEVDCGYLIWYRAQTLGLGVGEQLAVSFRNYTLFLKTLIDGGRVNIIVASVPPPTILDGQDWGAVALARTNVRIQVEATLAERTALTKRYNHLLRRWTVRNNVQFLDYEDEVLDPSTGLVRDGLRSRNRADHHLEPSALGPILVDALSRLGYT